MGGHDALAFKDVYDTSSDGVFAIEEDAMMWWAAFPSPCSEYCYGEWACDRCLLCEEVEDGESGTSSESGE